MISTDHTSIFHASVFDLYGRKLKSAQWFKCDKEDNFELDLSDMNAGIHFLQVTSRNKIVGIRKICIGTL
ncbi:MAG: T9SS type A sorting domain-containing protein [Saprospiraceae bacterium]|nr:T9SS type A sorting domain-containing protein [Saprospiraceae bacterium]